MSDGDHPPDANMFSFMTALKPDDPVHRCKSCGRRVGPGGPIIMWVSDAANNRWHFKCAHCRGFMEEANSIETKKG